MKTKNLFSSGKLLAAAGTITMLTFSACQKSIQQGELLTDEVQSESVMPQSHARAYVPNELIVKFNGGLSKNEEGNSLSAIGGTIEESIFTRTMQRSGAKEGVYLVHTAMDVNEAIARLKLDNSIDYAEPNYIYYHDAASNDTYYTNGSLWGMYGDATSPANQYGSQAGEAWAAGHTGSATVYVGVIDEGAMYAHEDLTGNFGNPGETAGDGIDNDGNGYVDDVYGWDFANNDNSTFDGLTDDHGTHVSGTIGGKGGNGKGVAGVNWNVKIISAKFLGSNGGTTANAIKAVDYITDFKVSRGINVVATNNSWGGGGFSQALQDAITRAGTAGILFIAAAGNDGLDTETSVSYPSGYPNDNIIAVASITSTGAISSFSNYAATKVDLGAPGSGIYSTLPARSKGQIVSSYGSYSGTSMATPHVTGAAALYKSTNPTATAAQIKAAILGATVPTASLTGKCVTGGRLNVSGF